VDDIVYLDVEKLNEYSWIVYHPYGWLTNTYQRMAIKNALNVLSMSDYPGTPVVRIKSGTGWPT